MSDSILVRVDAYVRAMLARTRSWWSAASTAVGVVLLTPFARRFQPAHLAVYAVNVYVARYLFWLLAIWGVQWWLCPTWLVSSRAGLQTLFQVIPAVIVAILVFVLGALFVIGQQVLTAYSSRAALLLIHGTALRGAVIRPLVITLAAVLLAGQVPDGGQPSHAVTAAAATLVLATVLVVRSSGVVLLAAFTEYTSPVNFVKAVLDHVDLYLEQGVPQMVRFRVVLLGDMARLAIRRGDSASLKAATGGLIDFQDIYIAVGQEIPQARTYAYDDHEQEGWLGEELSEALGTSMDEVLAGPGSEADFEKVANALNHAALRFTVTGFETEAVWMADALASSAVSVHQVTPSGTVNMQAKASPGLAEMERSAETQGIHDLAVTALANWCLVQSYAATQFGLDVHPRWNEDLQLLGDDPPWWDAGELIMSDEFTSRWFNKMPAGPSAVIAALLASVERHAQQHGQPVPQHPWNT
jgi:hypothetical protein